MSTDPSHELPKIERTPTGIPGFDAILCGGLVVGNLYVLMGQPGTGKTILSTELCFRHVRSGGRAVFVTLLAESHARMMVNLQSFDFFDGSVIGKGFILISGYSSLEKEGLKGLAALLKHEMRERQATLLVVDGLATAESFAASALDFKKLVYEIRGHAAAIGCTAIFATNAARSHPENTISDGILELRNELAGVRQVRAIEVLKFRGGDHLGGRHVFEIGQPGVIFHPRTEALLAEPSALPVAGGSRVPLDIAALDAMLEGGLVSGSAVMLLGSTGAGKTLLGLHFVAAGARRGESSVYFGFHETPPRLIAQGAAVGLDLAEASRKGLLHVHWQSAVEGNIDLYAERILTLVRERSVKRLVIDGIDAFRSAATEPERLAHFFTALMNELRALRVTTLFTVETTAIFGADIAVPMPGGSATVDAIVFLRHVELHSQIHRLISILKVRDSGHDSSIREFRISGDGITVESTFESAEAILTGTSRASAGGPAVRAKRRDAKKRITGKKHAGGRKAGKGR